jgi:D-aminopeptidase
VLNGNGEMTGTHGIEELGFFRGPIALTNTHSLGIVHHALIRWLVALEKNRDPYAWLMPVVAETCDAYLNDMDGLHVKEEHLVSAIENAAGGPVAEGNVGGGTGMVCYGFKGGIGTASRLVSLESASHNYHVGALVQANMGIRPWLNILGVPVGEQIDRANPSGAGGTAREQGSIVVLIGTDAPLLPGQLKRFARRAALGIGRTGTPSGDVSGDLCLAFSTFPFPEKTPESNEICRAIDYLPNHVLDPFFVAVVEAVEEAVVNALVAARTMVGRDDHRVAQLDHAQLCKLMKNPGRLASG